MRAKNDKKCTNKILTTGKIRKNPIDYLHHIKNKNMFATTVSKAVERNELIQYVATATKANKNGLVKKDAAVESTINAKCNQMLIKETRHMKSVTTATIKTTNVRSGIDIHVHFGGNCNNDKSSTTKKPIPTRCIQDITALPQNRQKVKGSTTENDDDNKQEKSDAENKKSQKTINVSKQEIETLSTTKKFRKLDKNEQIHLVKSQSTSTNNVTLEQHSEKVSSKRQTKKQSLKTKTLLIDNTSVTKNKIEKSDKQQLLKILTLKQLNRLNNLNKTSLEFSLKYILTKLSEISNSKGLELMNWSMVQQTITKLDQATQTSMEELDKIEQNNTEDDDDRHLVIDESFLKHTFISNKAFKIRNHDEVSHASAIITSTVGHIHQKLNEIEHRLMSIKNKKILTQKDKEEIFMLLKSLHEIEAQNGVLNKKSQQSFNNILVSCKKSKSTTTCNTSKESMVKAIEINHKNEDNSHIKDDNTNILMLNSNKNANISSIVSDKKEEFDNNSNASTINESINTLNTSQQNSAIENKCLRHKNVSEAEDNNGINYILELVKENKNKYQNAFKAFLDSSSCKQTADVISSQCNSANSDINCVTQTNEHEYAATNKSTMLIASLTAASPQLIVTAKKLTANSVNEESVNNFTRIEQDEETKVAESTNNYSAQTTNSLQRTDLCQHVEINDNNHKNIHNKNEKPTERIKSVCITKSLAVSKSSVNHSTPLTKDCHSSPKEDDWNSSTEDIVRSKIKRRNRCRTPSWSSQEMDVKENDFRRTFINKNKRSKFQHSTLKRKNAYIYKPKQIIKYDSDSTENWDTDEGNDGEFANKDLLQRVAKSINQKIQSANKPAAHKKEKQVNFDIASPDLSPPIEELSSPLKRPKIDLNNYSNATEINACMGTKNIIYFLYEVEMAQVKVNVPRSFEGLDANIMDPRLLKSKMSTSVLVNHSSELKLNDPRRRLSTRSFGKNEHTPQQETPNVLLYSYLQLSPWYQSLVSSMKMQINQSISELVRALNHFQRKRLLDPTIVFDVFKIDCAGELLEIMKNLSISIDDNGRICEKCYRTTTTVRHSCPSTNQPIPAASFISRYIDQSTLSTSVLNDEQTTNSRKQSSFRAPYISQRATIKSTSNEKFRRDSERDLSDEEIANFSRYRAPYERHRRDRFKSNSNWSDRRYQHGSDYRMH